MARHTSIYMIDKAKAITNLYNDLLNKVYHTGTFKKFIEDRRKKFNDNYMNFYSMLETIKSDVNLLTAEDIFEITLFLSEQIYSLPAQDRWENTSEQIESLYNHYGIIELFEIPSKTICTSYMFQYGNYTEFFPITELRNDFGVNIQSEDFLRFNDYVILSMKRILDSKLDDSNVQPTLEEESIIEAIKIKNKDNLYLFEVVEKELNFLIEMAADDNNGPYSQTIYSAYDFLIKSIEMKTKIDTEKNPRIIIVDA